MGPWRPDQKKEIKIDKLSPDNSHKEWRKYAFEIKLEIIYDMKSFNDMNYIHDNKANNVAECNLLRNIKNIFKRIRTWIAIMPLFYMYLWIHVGVEEYIKYQIL